MKLPPAHPFASEIRAAVVQAKGVYLNDVPVQPFVCPLCEETKLPMETPGAVRVRKGVAPVCVCNKCVRECVSSAASA